MSPARNHARPRAARGCRRVAWLLAALLAQAVAAQVPGEPYFETVGDPQSIPNGVVTCLNQDAAGFIWVGTQAGLLRYDGYRFQHYRSDPDKPDSLGDESIRDLLPRADGKLWVATQGGGVSVYDPLTDAFSHLRHDPAVADSLADDSVLDLATAADGGVWLGTATRGLDYWDPRSGRFSHFPPSPDRSGGIPSPTVRSLLVDRRGDLWVGTRDGLVRRRAAGGPFEPVASEPDRADSLDNRYVYSLFEASDGRIWAGTQNNGAVVIDPASGDWLHLPTDPLHPQGLSHPWVSNLLEPRPGQLWVLTFGAGIDIVDTRSLQVLRRLRHDPAVPSSLALELPTQPLLDRAGLVWVGTWGAGLQRHNPTADAFTSLRHSPLAGDGLSQASVLSALGWEDGRLWLGTGGNGIDVYHPQQGWLPGLRPDPSAAGALRDGTIRALARSRDGSVWVGTQQSGLFRWQGPQAGFRHVAGAGGNDDERIVHLFASRAGPLLVASQRGLAELDPASEQVNALALEGGEAFTDAVVALAEDAEGNLWVASALGLLLRPAGATELRRLTGPGQPGSLSSSTLLALHVDRAGQLWVATAAGIDRLRGWKGGQPQFAALALPELGQLGAFGGNRLLSDAQGRLWTQRHVIDPRHGRVQEIGRADGVDLGSTSLGAALALDDGRLLFGGTRGLLLIDPARYRPWAFAPPLAVTRLLIDGRAEPLARLQGGLVLAPQQHRLEVEFSALDYSAPERIRYAYRLDGYDEVWLPGEAGRRSASYSRLWPGRYTLRVRAGNRSGEWNSPELAIPIRVLPAWWQTPWFAAAVLATLLLLVLAGIRLRTRRIRERARALEALVQQRTAELSQAKEQAEQALDDLRGAQDQLVAAEKMASLGQLVAGVAHEINTPIGIAVTAASHMQDVSRGFAGKVDGGKLTRSDLATWQGAVEEAGRLILGSLERAHGLIGSFKQVAVDQSSEQRRSFDLATFLGEVQFALQPSYKRTPHRLEIDCPPGIELDTYPGALFQVITNLVNNSLLHAFETGQTGEMRIIARADAREVHLLYRDDGRGMSSEVVQRAFDPFFTTRRGSGGSGLGLHLVYNLTAQLLGGNIELHSAPGQGTEFELRFPRVAPVPAAVAGEKG